MFYFRMRAKKDIIFHLSDQNNRDISFMRNNKTYVLEFFFETTFFFKNRERNVCNGRGFSKKSRKCELQFDINILLSKLILLVI